MSCGVGCRCGSDPVLLWLWRRPVATAPIGPLAWEPPYAAGAALEKTKRQKKKKKKKRKKKKKEKTNIKHLTDWQKAKITSLELWKPCLEMP